MEAKTIQSFNRVGSTKNWAHHGRPKKLGAHAQRHIQMFSLWNRHLSAASIATKIEGVGGQSVSAQTLRPFTTEACCHLDRLSSFPIHIPAVAAETLSWEGHGSPLLLPLLLSLCECCFVLTHTPPGRGADLMGEERESSVCFRSV